MEDVYEKIRAEARKQGGQVPAMAEAIIEGLKRLSPQETQPKTRRKSSGEEAAA
jgi:hypothetical protein